MARNRLAGSRRGKSRSALFYHTHPEAREKKKEYDTKYGATKKRKKYRALLQAINIKNGTHGNLDHKDVAHTSKTTTISQSQSKNRGDKKRNFFK